jgi:hypothetical protein
MDTNGDGAPDWIRTSDLQLRRLPLYPSELRAREARILLEDPHDRVIVWMLEWAEQWGWSHLLTRDQTSDSSASGPQRVGNYETCMTARRVACGNSASTKRSSGYR